MTISGRSLGHASRVFADQLNRTLNTTITQRRLRVFLLNQLTAEISFQRRDQQPGIPLSTMYGRIMLDLRKICDAIEIEGSPLTLRTLAYRYTIRPIEANEPLLRWEYVRFPADPDATWSRHHIQGPIPLGIRNRSGVEANLNGWHTPTGPIAIEDVLRFCITDLGVRPLNAEWHQQLEKQA